MFERTTSHLNLPYFVAGENTDREGELSFSMYRKKHYAKDYGADDSGFDLNATRTLFVGNLDKQMTHGDLRKIFEKFGEVVVGFFHMLLFRKPGNNSILTLFVPSWLKEKCVIFIGF